MKTSFKRDIRAFTGPAGNMAFVIFLISAIAANAQTKNGTWWKSVNSPDSYQNERLFLDHINAIGYVAGVADGILNFDSENIPPVTTGQVCDGVTNFYNDFRNQNILVVDAVWVVLHQIAGTPPDSIIQADIEHWRQYPGWGK